MPHAPSPRGHHLTLGLTAGLIALTLAVGLFFAVASAQGGSGGTGPQTTSKKSGGDRYTRIWNQKVRKSEKRWARRTSECESGGNRRIHGGGGRYHGAFQFMKSTWRSSPKSPGGDPHRYRWKTQAVVAVYLKRRDGKGHWPHCG